MSTIKIARDIVTMPKGRYVADQSREIYQTSDGLPTVSLKWENTSFLSKDTWLGCKETWFVFARDALLVAELPEKVAKDVVRAVGFVKGARVVPYSGVFTLAAGAMLAAGAKTSNVRGIAVLYRNEQQNLGVFDAAGPAEVIEWIVSSVPPRAVVALDGLKAEFRRGGVPEPQLSQPASQPPRVPLGETESRTCDEKGAPPKAPSGGLYIALSGEVKGPFTTDQLKALLVVETIANDTPCCHDGADAWRTVSAYVTWGVRFGARLPAERLVVGTQGFLPFSIDTDLGQV